MLCYLLPAHKTPGIKTCNLWESWGRQREQSGPFTCQRNQRELHRELLPVWSSRGSAATSSPLQPLTLTSSPGQNSRKITNKRAFQLPLFWPCYWSHPWLQRHYPVFNSGWSSSAEWQPAAYNTAEPEVLDDEPPEQTPGRRGTFGAHWGHWRSISPPRATLEFLKEWRCFGVCYHCLVTGFHPDFGVFKTKEKALTKLPTPRTYCLCTYSHHNSHSDTTSHAGNQWQATSNNQYQVTSNNQSKIPSNIQCQVTSNLPRWDQQLRDQPDQPRRARHSNICHHIQQRHPAPRRDPPRPLK